MKSVTAIKRFLEAEPNGIKTGMTELAGFKKDCTQEEWEQMGRDACAAIGEEWEASN